MKSEKKLPAKKLPGLFKKSYTAPQFKKKILGKIYIDADRKLVLSLFSEKIKKGKTEKIRIPRTAEFTKKELKTLKGLAKSIKSNKGVVRRKAFIAVASVVFAVVFLFLTFKNPLAKLGIRSAMQFIYGSKCDIQSVKVELLGAKLTINKLAQANPNHPMKNFYEFDKLELDFNLTQLLRSRYNIENIEISGIAFDTPRTTSGELSLKESFLRRKLKTDALGFYDSLEKKSEASLTSAKGSLENLFAQYDPQKLYDNIQSQMKTPAMCKEIEESLTSSIAEWKAKPAEIKNTVSDFRDKSEKLVAISVKNLKTREEIQAALDDVAAAIKSGQNVKNTVDSTVAAVEKEQKKVNNLQKKLEDAIKRDSELVSAQVKNISFSGATDFITSSIDGYAYSVIGKYYPYLKMGITYLSSVKSSKSEKNDEKSKAEIKKQKENAKKEHKRYAGRYVYWRADTVPRLLIENVHGSGFGFDFKITDISSDMDKVGRPVVGKMSYSDKKRTHSASLTLDGRSKSKEPLVTATYSGNNFPLKMRLSKLMKADGIPDLSGTTAISGSLSADTDFSFGGSCSVSMNPLTVTSQAISPDYADEIYQAALASVKTMNAAFDFGFSEEKGVNVNVVTDLEKQILNGLKNSAGTYLSEVRKEASALIQANLNENSKQAFSKISEFTDISASVKDQKTAVDLLDKKLKEKQKELTKALAEKAASKVSEKANKAISNNAAASKAMDAASGLLKGLKK